MLELRSRFGFLAFHGGSLEERTDVIAAAAAEQAGASYYGVLQPADLQWHIPSTQVGPADSSALGAFLDHVEVAVAVHGYGRMGYWTTLLVGGGNRDLAARLGVALAGALPAYQVVTDLERIPAGLRGLHRDNPVNLPSGGGVQLELPPRVRGNTPRCPPPDAHGLVPDSRALVAALVEAATSWTTGG